MTYFDEKITTFYKKYPEPMKKALEKIINNMIYKCRYINGESLERHNWGNRPIKLNNIPEDIRSSSFEEELLIALNLEDNEKSIVELLWGDIQLGKRVHACIIMWISVYILKRPVLYIFRNLTIDQKQLQDDITGTENYNFNIQFIKNIFTEFNKEISEYFQETDEEYYKDFRLPGLKDINSDANIDKLSSKEGMDTKDIFCCLMNHSALAKINTKFSQYIHYNNELVDITILVDESDLLSPTSSNDRTNDNDKKDSTICEILLAKIYKKVKYALQITGTAHSLLYNVTTRLSDHTNIQIKISKVHKMIRADDYYGLFNDKISFNTTLVQPWWDYKDDDNKKNVYDIGNDYNINIKKIIDFILYKRPLLNQILKKPNQKYNSLLISEEKIRAEQFSLVKKIIKDFPDLFIIIYHGNCLRLYLSKKYEKEIKRLSQWDAQQSSSQRLHQPGGVYGSSIDTEKYEKLPNNYCYFNIDTKILNIKLVYKLLRILFEKSDTHITYKTIITITGKYGERGYSFTSDDYDNYSLHLTDQYFVSHTSLNCTNESQEMRVQLKSNDIEIKNGTMKLILWTTPLLQDVMQNFYVKFIKEIEKYIMTCKSWEEIKDLLESIIDNGDFKFGKYMKYIDVSKKRKNLKPMKHFDKKNNGYKLIVADNMSDTEISEWCKETHLPEYICINEIQEMNIDEFIDKYGDYKIKQEFCKLENFTFEEINKIIDDISKKNNIKLGHITRKWFEVRQQQFNELGYYAESCRSTLQKIKKEDLVNSNDVLRFNNGGQMNIHNGKRRIHTCYDENDNLYICISLVSDDKQIPKQTNDYIKKTPYIIDGDKVKYSILKEEYKQQNNNTHGYTNEDGDDFIEDDNKFPEKYYWKTSDGWLYYYDKDKPEIISLNIVAPLSTTNVIQTIVSTQILLNPDIVLFAEQCCKKTNIPNLRFGLKEIYVSYETWCKINNKKSLKTQKKFKEEFEKLNYKEEISKGVDINNNSGKRGYNIMVKL
jgi:hypothetical protein